MYIFVTECYSHSQSECSTSCQKPFISRLQKSLSAPATGPRARLSGFRLAASLSWSEAGSQAVTLMFKGLANWYVRVAYQLRNNIPH